MNFINATIKTYVLAMIFHFPMMFGQGLDQIHKDMMKDFITVTNAEEIVAEKSLIDAGKPDSKKKGDETKADDKTLSNKAEPEKKDADMGKESKEKPDK